ncbi:hypothetical protein [Massilia sp.]|uniref:hypothetical protein n=1 Tax=Massilia sp. TaxID=1882437 RepID=UPI00352C4B05
MNRFVLPTILLALLSFHGSVLACWAPPQQQLIGVDEQVALATDVTIAQVVSAVPGEMSTVDYTFVVRERLAGPARPLFTLAGGQHRDGDVERDFDHHADPVFWRRGGGRSLNGSDCVIRPTFEVGATYLVFAAPPFTWRSFERIDAADDRWLAWVRAALRDGKKGR